MKLTVIGTGSTGNAYALQSTTGEILLIECGVKMDEIKKAIDFKVNNVVGCILSHSHGDHSLSINQMFAAGIDVYATYETHIKLDTKSSHRAKSLKLGDDESGYPEFALGEFRIKAFDVKHDVPCVGFLINHVESGKILFLTDTYYCPYSFTGLTTMIVEANFSHEVLKNKYSEDQVNTFLRDRIFKSHMSLETCVDLLKANSTPSVENIILIHLSDSNSDEYLYQQMVFKAVKRKPKIAINGAVYDIHKYEF